MSLHNYKLGYEEIDSAKSKHTRFFYHKEWIGSVPRLSKERVQATKEALQNFFRQPHVTTLVFALIENK